MEDTRDTQLMPKRGLNYFDRVLNTCKGAKVSVTSFLVDVDQRIGRVVDENVASDPASSHPSPAPPALRSDRSLILSQTIKHPLSGGATQPIPNTGPRNAPAVTGISANLKNVLTSAYLLCGRFELVKVLGATSCGVLFKALDRRKLLFEDAFPYVSLEVLSEKFQRCANWQALLQREASRSAALTHRNIVPIYDYQRDGSAVFVVMEHGKRISLHDVLSGQSPGQRLTPHDAMKVITGVGAALAFAHGLGIAHGGLNPGSVVIDKFGEAQLIDFGIGSILPSEERASVFEFSHKYQSPDVAQGAAPTLADDIFSFGCLAYHLLTGSCPFGDLPTAEAQAKNFEPPQRDGLSWQQLRTLKRMLNFAADKRPKSASRLARELAGWSWLIGPPQAGIHLLESIPKLKRLVRGGKTTRQLSTEAEVTADASISVPALEHRPDISSS